MRLFLNLDNNIASFDSRKFVCFPMKNVFFTIWCPLINLYFKNFLFFNYFFSITSFTFIFFLNLFTLTTTIVARTSSLCVHTRSQHLHCSSHSFTITSFACLDRTRFASSSFTFCAHSISVYNNF